MDRVFRKFAYISMAVSTLCAGVAFCASVTDINSYSSCCGVEKKQAENSRIFSGTPDAACSKEMPQTLFDAALQETALSLVSLPAPQCNQQECIWFTPKKSYNHDSQNSASRYVNNDGSVVTASSDGAFDMSNPLSPSGLLMIITSLLALGGYILERIITGRGRPSYRR